MFYIAHISLALIVVFFIVIARMKTKNRLKRYFIAFNIELFVWTVGTLAQQYLVNFGREDLTIYFENLTYFGVAFIPAQMLLICMAFTSSGLKTRGGRASLFLIPAITQVVIWTNELHHAFYISYSFIEKHEVAFGWYFYIHTVYSYACILGAIIFVIIFAVKNRGAANAQAFTLLVGSIVPVVVNIGFTFDLGGFTIFSTPVAFLITVLAYFFGVFRFNLIRLTPIAMKTVIDKTSDLYIVVDESMMILDYNEPFFDIFSPLMNVKRQISLAEALPASNRTGFTAEEVALIIKECRKSRGTIKRKYKLEVGEDVRQYSMEFTALIIENEYCGCIMLFRDVTQAMKDMEEIQRNHIRLIEQERLASLGQLIGGIAHNLKTPIMAMSGRTQNLEALIHEYEVSAGDEKVTAEDHKEIAREMKEEVGSIQNQISYISEIITTVKEQTTKYEDDYQETFTIDELVRRIRILMQHELIRNNCELIDDIQTDDETRMTGDINSFVQVIDNIIINAIYAYEGKHGKIWLKISGTPEDVIISVRDEAKGIPPDVQEKLFKQMITTKGKDGTGLGMYISYSTIVGRYEGKMWFETTQGQGSEFFISIPLRNEERSA